MIYMLIGIRSLTLLVMIPTMGTAMVTISLWCILPVVLGKREKGEDGGPPYISMCFYTGLLIKN